MIARNWLEAMELIHLSRLSAFRRGCRRGTVCSGALPFILIAASITSVVVRWCNDSLSQHNAVVSLEASGADCVYSSEGSNDVNNVRAWFDGTFAFDFVDHVIYVALPNRCRTPDPPLEALASLSSLEELNASFGFIVDRDMKFIGRLTKLRRLNLQDTRISDAGLAPLCGLTHLQYLILSDTKITDVGAQQLRCLSALQVLKIGNTKITDAALRSFQKLQSLTTLDVRGTKITDTGLRYIEKLSRLQRIEINGTQVSRVGAARLRQALPKCEVVAQWNN
jgi:hypothetical protein